MRIRSPAPGFSTFPLVQHPEANAGWLSSKDISLGRCLKKCNECLSRSYEYTYEARSKNIFLTRKFRKIHRRKHELRRTKTCATKQLCSPYLTLALVGGVGWTPPWFFADNSRKTRRIAAKLTVPSRWSIWHILWKFQVDVMSGHQLMTSYVRSCSDEIGRFCDLSHNGARSCFPAYEYAFHES